MAQYILISNKRQEVINLKDIEEFKKLCLTDGVYGLLKPQPGTQRVISDALADRTIDFVGTLKSFPLKGLTRVFVNTATQNGQLFIELGILKDGQFTVSTILAISASDKTAKSKITTTLYAKLDALTLDSEYVEAYIDNSIGLGNQFVTAAEHSANFNPKLVVFSADKQTLPLFIIKNLHSIQDDVKLATNDSLALDPMCKDNKGYKDFVADLNRELRKYLLQPETQLKQEDEDSGFIFEDDTKVEETIPEETTPEEAIPEETQEVVEQSETQIVEEAFPTLEEAEIEKKPLDAPLREISVEVQATTESVEPTEPTETTENAEITETQQSLGVKEPEKEITEEQVASLQESEISEENTQPQESVVKVPWTKGLRLSDIQKVLGDLSEAQMRTLLESIAETSIEEHNDYKELTERLTELTKSHEQLRLENEELIKNSVANAEKIARYDKLKIEYDSLEKKANESELLIQELQDKQATLLSQIAKDTETIKVLKADYESLKKDTDLTDTFSDSLSLMKDMLARIDNRLDDLTQPQATPVNMNLTSSVDTVTSLNESLASTLDTARDLYKYIEEVKQSSLEAQKFSKENIEVGTTPEIEDSFEPIEEKVAQVSIPTPVVETDEEELDMSDIDALSIPDIDNTDYNLEQPTELSDEIASTEKENPETLETTSQQTEEAELEIPDLFGEKDAEFESFFNGEAGLEDYLKARM